MLGSEQTCDKKDLAVLVIESVEGGGTDVLARLLLAVTDKEDLARHLLCTSARAVKEEEEEEEEEGGRMR